MTTSSLSTMDYQTHMPALESITRSHVNTQAAAFYLSRKPQTLRMWACYENGPIRAVRVNKRLAWPVDQIRNLLADGN